MGIHLHTHIKSQEFVLIKTTSEAFVKLRFGERERGEEGEKEPPGSSDGERETEKRREGEMRKTMAERRGRELLG